MKYKYLIILIGIVVGCKDKTRFERLNSNDTGITFSNIITETDSLHVMNFEYIYNGAGVGVVDVNNDELPDLIFTGNQVPTKLYLNEGNLKFRDISSCLVGINSGQWISGVSVVDINSDGWLDLYFTLTAYKESEQRKNKLLVHQGLDEKGIPKFAEMAVQYGIADDHYSVQASFLDIDLDGDLDMYLLNNYLTERLTASYRERILDGSAVSNDQLYRNNGDGTFTNITLEAGILYEGFGLGIATGDVNKDGYPDLYISNDYVSNDLLYINQKDGTFKNEIARYMSYQTKSSMGNDMADVNNDGYLDIYTLDMLPESYHKKKQTINGFSYIYYEYDKKFGYEHQYLRNMLHLNNGLINGELVPLSEVGQMMGIEATEWSWSPLFGDYDNDGDKDLLVANGYPRDLTDKDWTRYKAQVYGFVADEKHVMGMAPAIRAENFAFENIGELEFKKVSDEWFEPTGSYSYGAAFSDLDNDGDLDYVVNNMNGEAFIYKNTTADSENKNSYLQIRLIGKPGNTLALGAKVELWSGGNYQYLENYLSRGYISSVDPVVHFGLNKETTIDSVRITWPTNKTYTILKRIDANQRIEVNENSALTFQQIQPIKAYLFYKKDSVINYLHQQDDYIDFFIMQHIMPHKFSQIGPVISKGDLNGDGLEDLLIGSTNKTPTTVYCRHGDTFVLDSFDGLTLNKSFSEGDIAIVDVDNDGDNDVVAVAGGYENAADSDYKHFLYINNNGVFTAEQLPIPGFSSTTVRPFDFDNDGDKDLFIGSRVKKEQFPYAVESWILINDNGRYPAEKALQFDLGMVTDAVWSDFNGDGWNDLVITREWNSIGILQNNDGKAFTQVKDVDLNSRRGFWYSITAADFDGDGDDDYLAGNLGMNHRFNVNEKYPLRMRAFDTDRNGSLDPFFTGYWPDSNNVMREYPVNYLDELVAQSPILPKLFKDYASFSYATIEDILDTAIIRQTDDKFFVNTTESCILWNDNGKFTWQALPLEVQISPVKKTVVTDLNNDNLPDIILTGNDYTFDVSTGYYDANKGLALLSENNKPLARLLKPSESGLMIQGMVESLIYLEKDHLLVAGINRKPIEVFNVLPK